MKFLAGAARQLVDPVAAVARECELPRQRLARARSLIGPEVVGTCEQLDVLVHRELVPQQRLLRAVTEPSSQDHLATVTRQQADDDLHQRALPRAVLADEADQLAGAHIKRRTAQHLGTPAMPWRPTTERLGDGVDLEQRPRGDLRGVRRRRNGVAHVDLLVVLFVFGWRHAGRSARDGLRRPAGVRTAGEGRTDDEAGEGEDDRHECKHRSGRAP